jgi:alkylhydroperoxidase family enzyme
MSGAAADPTDPGPAIAALRAQGAPRLDAVRFSHIEALARRAAAHQGEVRRVLDGKLAPLLAACAAAVAQQAETARAAAAPALASPRGALADLLAHLAHSETPASAHAGPARPDTLPPAELKTVRYYRSTWARLSADRRLTQSLARVPENAGPLHTQRLLHQALTVMRDVSPAYLHRLLSQVETLLWLDPASPAGAVAKKDPPRSARDKKAAGTRPR